MKIIILSNVLSYDSNLNAHTHIHKRLIRPDLSVTILYLMRSLNRLQISDWRDSRLETVPLNVHQPPRNIRENDFPLADRGFSRDQWIADRRQNSLFRIRSSLKGI